MQRRIADPYAQCKELDGWDLYAVDGHYHKAACFDPKSVASDGTLRATATGHFFRMNMRTHHLSCLAMAEPKDGKKKEHDMAAIKRSSAEQLRNGAPVGRKVMLIWDKACIDYRHWHKLKHTYGIYFVTLEKSNSAAEICSVNQIDHTDPGNEGVVTACALHVEDCMWRLKLSKKLLALPRHRGYESRHGQKTMDCDESECGGASGFLPLCFAGCGPQAGVRAG